LAWLIFGKWLEMNWKTLALVVVVVAAAALLLAQGQAAKALGVGPGPATPLEKQLAAFGEKRGQDFIYFNDSNYSLAIKYPIGYEALYYPDPQVMVRFRALNPGGVSEVIDVSVSDTVYGRSDFDRDMAGFPVTQGEYSAKVVAKEEGEINGRKAFFATLNQSVGGEPAWTKITAVDCGDYSAFISATVPESISSDRVVAEYMIRSLRC